MSKIEIEGTREDGEWVVVTVDSDNLLSEVDDEDIAEYARWSLNMKHEDDFESSLEDFDNDALWDRLDNSYSFNVFHELDIEDILDYVESQGYSIDKSDFEDSGLDFIDAGMLEEITQKFLNGSWAERVELHNKIMNL